MKPLSTTATMILCMAGLAAAQQYQAMPLTTNMASAAWAGSAALAGGSTFVAGPGGANVQHASLFAGGGVTDLNPSLWYASTVLGIAGAQQAGLGWPVASADASTGSHAVLWSGSAASVVDLHPGSPYIGSGAACTTGVMQGGYGILKGKSLSGGVKVNPPNHAMVWFGTARSFIDLNPANASESRINGCSDAQQAGYFIPLGGMQHAAIWQGSASSVIDLHPASGYLWSTAMGASGTQQAGYAVLTPDAGGAGHAVVWFGSAASIVDLHPAGYTLSVAFATNGVQQVGEADDNGFPRHKHAMVWSGSAASAIDLNQFLPAGYTDAQAMAIDAAGNIIGYAGQTAFLWKKL